MELFGTKSSLESLGGKRENGVDKNLTQVHQISNFKDSKESRNFGSFGLSFTGESRMGRYMKRRISWMVGVLFIGGMLHGGESGEPPFERPQIWPATAFLPANFLQGDGWMIGSEVYNDGLYNTWWVHSQDAGHYQVTGNERLVTVIREVQAILHLQSISRTREFALAMRDAGQAQLDAAVRVLENPVETVRSIPSGAGRLCGAVGGTIRNAARGELNTDPDAETAAQRISGFDRARRELAASLGVNVHSRNALLHQQLSDVARVQTMGRLTMRVGAFVVAPAPLGAAMTGINVTDGLTREQVQADPRELDERSRSRMMALGASAGDADAMLANPFYDSWTVATLVNTLGPMQGVDLGPFFALARFAATEEDASFFIGNAQLMARFHTEESPVVALLPMTHTVACRLADGGIMVPIVLDFAIWSPALKAGADRLRSLVEEENGSAAWIVTSGSFSETAASVLEGRGFRLLTRYLQ